MLKNLVVVALIAGLASCKPTKELPVETSLLASPIESGVFESAFDINSPDETGAVPTVIGNGDEILEALNLSLIHI